jgi:hypothetical protein
MDDGPATYSVYVQFRHRRLTLRRRIPSLASASAFVHSVRATRFRDPDSVFIVHDGTGELVEPTRTALASGAHDHRDEAFAAALRATTDALTAVRTAANALPAGALSAAIADLDSACAKIAVAAPLDRQAHLRRSRLVVARRSEE